ncbi:hepatocyte nuclear factor 4-gamma-like isoform X2 [Pollicipes pollicipes]|uniref:hepatocyte nuclear factor 4-gamma-like isoform X2 n=1 Tax=Pollicipes pollicipes TaxID=41117 RepID=UPI00188573F6|nr:hepatocyte nuclear factor 4-gamma-like isoform X2 [Pollicipes pollicipes]
MNKIGGRLMDEVIRPLREMQVDESEYAALKAIVFFDPAASRGCDGDTTRIEQYRYQIQLNLEDYITDLQYNQRGRFGAMLLILPSLQSIAREMVEQIQLMKLFGGARVDNLLVEMLLGGGSGDDSPPTGTPSATLALAAAPYPPPPPASLLMSTPPPSHSYMPGYQLPDLPPPPPPVTSHQPPVVASHLGSPPAVTSHLSSPPPPVAVVAGRCSPVIQRCDYGAGYKRPMLPFKQEACDVDAEPAASYAS